MQHGTPAGTVSISEQGDTQNVRIEAHNRGPAIHRDHLEDIFEPLLRASSDSARETGSLGLGLYIVRRIATAHGGNVSVTSTDTEGTTFVVVIPRKPQIS